MVIFKSKPRTVEAKQISDAPTKSEVTEILEWLRKCDPTINIIVRERSLDLYFGGTICYRAHFGKWLVVLGGSQFQILDPGMFNQLYEWIGPKAYADPPYLVN